MIWTNPVDVFSTTRQVVFVLKVQRCTHQRRIYGGQKDPISQPAEGPNIDYEEPSGSDLAKLGSCEGTLPRLPYGRRRDIQ